MNKSNKPKNEPIGEDILNIFYAEEELKTTTTNKSTKSKESNSKGIYTCERCKKNLKSKMALLRHQERHNKKDNEGRKYKCNICHKGNTKLKIMFLNNYNKLLNLF